jgi:hypothetical protein
MDFIMNKIVYKSKIMTVKFEIMSTFFELCNANRIKFTV